MEITLKWTEIIVAVLGMLGLTLAAAIKARYDARNSLATLAESQIRLILEQKDLEIDHLRKDLKEADKEARRREADMKAAHARAQRTEERYRRLARLYREHVGEIPNETDR